MQCVVQQTCWENSISATLTDYEPDFVGACDDLEDWLGEEDEEDATCDWVAKDPDERCVTGDDHSRLYSGDACPEACGCDADADDDAEGLVPEPTGACETGWYSKKKSRDCDWVAKKDKRCTKENWFNVAASDACAVCGDCSCDDSTSWYFKKSKKDCEWVAKSNSKRCKKKGTDDTGTKRKAKDACPDTCGEC